MLLIFLHEVFDQMKSLRFQVSLVVLLLFFVANGVIYSLKMERLVTETGRIRADAEQRYTEVETLDNAVGRWYYVLNEPTGTEFIAEGSFNWFFDRMWVNPGTGNGAPIATFARTTNFWIRRFEIVDWTLIVRLVVSFLGIVMSYDAISGGLESGTLRLVLANPLSRGRLLIARYLAHLVILLVAVAVGALVSLLILALNGVLELDLRVLGSVSLFFAATAFYVSLFLFLAMAVSGLARSSASSLVLLVLLWAVVTVVIPQTSYLVGSRVEVPEEDFSRQWEFMDEIRTALQRQGISPRGRDRGKADNYAMEKNYARRIRDAGKEQEQIVRRRDGGQLAQYRVARIVNLLSPGFAYQYALEGLLGTGLARRLTFQEQAWRYRETLRQFLKGRDAADPDSPHILFFAEYMSQKKLDPADIPRFKEVPLSTSASLEASMVPAVILLLETCLAFLLALWAINRADLTGE